MAVHWLSLVVVSGGCSLAFSVLLLQSRGSRHTGSVVVAHRFSFAKVYEILLDQGSSLCPLHW